MEGMTTAQVHALIRLAMFLPLVLVVIAVYTRHFPVMVSLVILWAVAYFLNDLTIPGWPHRGLIIHAPEYLAYWCTVAVVVSFLLRAQKSAFAMMRAIVAPVVFADYLFFLAFYQFKQLMGAAHRWFL